MSFRGKLRLKLPSLDRSHANAEPHRTRHETRDNIQVPDDSGGDGIRRSVVVVVVGGGRPCEEYQCCCSTLPSCGGATQISLSGKRGALWCAIKSRVKCHLRAFYETR